MVVLSYLPKLKRDLGLAFGAHFLRDFSIKILLIWYSTNWQSFNITPFFLLKVSNKMCYKVLIYAIDDVINFKIFLRSSSKALAGRQTSYLEAVDNYVYYNVWYTIYIENPITSVILER